ncbi:hypothetical protein MMC25_004432 [Agyrium rufum]|nr:hypothetical protein [Agyrium rufum]
MSFSPLLPPPSSPWISPERNVEYIPSQMDALAASTTLAARENPMRLLLRDSAVLVRMLTYLPWVFLPIRSKDEDAELHPSLHKIRDVLLQIALTSFEALVLVLAPIAMLCSPGVITLGLGLIAWGIIWALAKPMQGPRIVYSKLDAKIADKAAEFADERWLFINGCFVGHHGLQENIDRLSRTFCRPMIGIHNQTYGLIADLIECLIQRDLQYNTMDVRVAYDNIKASLADPSVKKVVLIAHSQGGIIASMVLDQLYTELPIETIGKMEIYTFGSAASHFSNPLLTLPSPRASFASVNRKSSSSSETVTSSPPRRQLSLVDSASDSPLPSPTASPRPQSTPLSATTSARKKRRGRPQRCIQYIEHYVNEYDMVSRWGVLHCVKAVLNNTYSGKIFVRTGASGHLFVQHYLGVMFPLKNTVKNVIGSDGDEAEDGGGGGGDEALERQEEGKEFLDEVVDVDASTAMERETESFMTLSGSLSSVGHGGWRDQGRSEDVRSRGATTSRVSQFRSFLSGFLSGWTNLPKPAPAPDSRENGDGPNQTIEFGNGAEIPIAQVEAKEKAALARLAGLRNASAAASLDAQLPFNFAMVREAGAAKEKTVRELSRLWRYMDGQKPHDKE